MTDAHTDELSARQRDRIIKSAVAPRPIAWVSTISEDGIDNLAPFSSYNYVTSSTPVVVFNSADTAEGEHKDTVANAMATEEFVVNVVTESLAEQMDQTASSIPSDVSEFDYADVDRAESSTVVPPRVANAVVSLECELYDTKHVYEKTMVFGEVVHIHVDESAKRDGKIDSRNLDQVGRLGGPYYTGIRRLDLERS